MTTTMIFAGSGGQGIQFSGKQMAKTGMYVGKNVTFLPSYGPEMRGGTSNCTVVISDEEIGSPTQVERIFPPEKNTQHEIWEGDGTELGTKVTALLKQRKFI